MTTKQHAFTPGADGATCNVVLYPAHARCGKSPHAMVHNGKRPTPPELDFPYPPCSICGEDTYHDGDSFRCDPCGAIWSGTGPGEWMEPELEVCGATRKPFDRDYLEPKYEKLRHYLDYCIREKGHDGPHGGDGGFGWESSQ